MSDSFRIKYRIAVDELSLVALRTCMAQRKRRQIKEEESKKFSEEHSNSNADENPQKLDSESKETTSCILNSNNKCPSIPETVLYYKKDRQREAKNQVLKRRRKHSEYARKNAKREGFIIPTAQALTPEKQKRRQKGEIPCDNKSIYIQNVRSRTQLRKLKQKYKPPARRKTPREDLYDTSDEESKLSMHDSRATKKQKLQSSNRSAASLGQKEGGKIIKTMVAHQKNHKTDHLDN